MSTISCIGLDGDSKNTAVVGSDRAARHCSRSGPSTKTVSTPQRGRISFRITKQEPNSERAATTRSPAASRAPRAVNTADMPDAVAKHASVPSSRRRRSWNVATEGLP